MKTVIANTYIEVLCKCPNCGCGQDIFDNDFIKGSLTEDHRASGCNVEIQCEECSEKFLVTDIDF